MKVIQHYSALLKSYNTTQHYSSHTELLNTTQVIQHYSTLLKSYKTTQHYSSHTKLLNTTQVIQHYSALLKSYNTTQHYSSHTTLLKSYNTTQNRQCSSTSNWHIYFLFVWSPFIIRGLHIMLLSECGVYKKDTLSFLLFMSVNEITLLRVPWNHIIQPNLKPLGKIRVLPHVVHPFSSYFITSFLS
jgi:hypothetical protein